METVRFLDELTLKQQALAGGKGETLARLYQAGYPVPESFVILPSAFSSEELTPEAWQQVQACLTRLRKEDDSTGFAVRSSAVGEDSPQASFAGEFETVLGVHTDQEIHQAIHVVYRSQHEERAQAYSQAKGIDPPREMAVIVQRMVPAEWSGVLFTADPITGSRMAMRGSFVHGLCERLVSGEDTGQTFEIERPSGRYQGAAELKRHARSLYRLASRLVGELGQPQDIEWAIAGPAEARGRLYLLQSRPITTLIGYNPSTGEWNDSHTGDYLWSNVNFGEAVSEAMTPLAWTVLQLVLEEWVFLPGTQTTGNIGGRPYLNISIFATVFHALGRSHQDLLQTLESTLYMRLPEGMEIPLLPVSRWSLPSLLPNLLRIEARQRRGIKDLPAFLATNPAWCQEMQKQIRGAATKAELLSRWQGEIRPHITGSVWIILGSASHSSDYTIQLRRELTELVGSDDAHLLISSVSGDSGSLASLAPLVGLAKVAQGDMDRETYLERYGHRGPHEFELSIPRPAEDPAWLDQQVAQFDKSPVDVEALLARQRAEFEAAWDRFEARYPRKAKPIRRRINEAARRTRLRELARSEYVRDRWLVRLFALRAGELTGLGDDVFFLTIDEVLNLLSGDETAVGYIPARKRTYERYRALPACPSIIRGRFDLTQWAADPNRRSDLFDAHAPIPGRDAERIESEVITGSPGSAGRVEGTVRRLDHPGEGDELQEGEILVTIQTDIAWTPLFPRAAAIVTDVGAPLSHAAIVARELGIPAVVGCGDATMRLQTGDRVIVDGGKGIVKLWDVLRPEATVTGRHGPADEQR